MANVATRLFTLLMLLQRQPNQKAACLAAELGISVRSLHRYMAMLEDMGIPVYAERGPYGGFSLVRGYKMPPLAFTPEEAVAVYLGASLVGEMWGRLYQEAAQGALAKLEHVLPNDQRQEVAWARRALVVSGLHRSDADALAPNLEILRAAIRQQRRVSLVYLGSSQPEATCRQVDPYALVHSWGWWYVAGFCHLRQAVRSFRVDRIQKLELLEVNFQAPAGFNIQAYLASEPLAQPPLQVRLRFAPPGAWVARGQAIYWSSLEEQPDGSLLVTFLAYDMEYAAATALSYGALVQVLEPESLRRLVVQRARAITELYLEESD
jgi:predicted DNA-binding transcriptional regulator YafY